MSYIARLLLHVAHDSEEDAFWLMAGLFEQVFTCANACFQAANT